MARSQFFDKINFLDKTYTCDKCGLRYFEYEELVAHLYWRHGTESQICNKCGLKKWKFAPHQCNILPGIEVEVEDSESEADSQYFSEERSYCICGKISDGPMVGCDGPKCIAQWYHFECIGMITAPEGQWYCNKCSRKSKKRLKNGNEA